MIRTVAAKAALALATLLLAAAPAYAASKSDAGIRVSLTGKSPAQIHTDIVKAASKVCFAETSGQPLFAYLYTSCLRDSVGKAVAQINDPALLAYSQTHSSARAD